MGVFACVHVNDSPQHWPGDLYFCVFACAPACLRVWVCACFHARMDSYVVVGHTRKTTQDKQNNSNLSVYPNADVRCTHTHRQKKKKKNLDQEDRRRRGATV